MIRKTGEIVVPTKPMKQATKITNFTFKSYEKNSNALQFEIKNQDGSPTDLIGATVRLFMYIYVDEEKKEFPIFDNQLITESYMRGIIKYPVPDTLLDYEGKVDANVYIDFPDGTYTDNLAFTFTIEKSLIDSDVSIKGEYYFKDFQQLLNSMTQETTDAINGALEGLDETVGEAVNQMLTDATTNINDSIKGIWEVLEGVQLDNYFNKDKIEKDKSIANLTGVVVDAPGANISGYISVKDMTVLGCNHYYNTAGCFYDANLKYITFARFSDSDTAGWYTLTRPENAMYIRVVVTTAHLNDYMLRPSKEKPTQYYPYQVSVSWLQQESALANKKVITFGDSITWQDGQTINGENIKGYQSYFREAGAIVTNEGVGNMTFAKNNKAGAEELYLYKKIVLENYDLTGIDIVTIACGTNDVAFGVSSGDVGTITSTDFDTSTSFGALRAILEYIRLNYPTVDIYLLTPLQNKTRDMVKHQAMADGIIAISGYYGAPVFDLFRRSGIGKYTFDIYTRDGLHPNNAGYALYGPRLVRMLGSE